MGSLKGVGGEGGSTRLRLRVPRYLIPLPSAPYVEWAGYPIQILGILGEDGAAAFCWEHILRDFYDEQITQIF